MNDQEFCQFGYNCPRFLKYDSVKNSTDGQIESDEKSSNGPFCQMN